MMLDNRTSKSPFKKPAAPMQLRAASTERQLQIDARAESAHSISESSERRIRP